MINEKPPRHPAETAGVSNLSNTVNCSEQNPDASSNQIPLCQKDPQALARLADFYKIMADETRLCILLSLEQKEQCVSDLAAQTGMSLSAVSHQLKTLKNAKLVKGRKEGKSVYYSLDDDHIHSIIKVALTHILEEH